MNKVTLWKQIFLKTNFFNPHPSILQIFDLSETFWMLILMHTRNPQTYDKGLLVQYMDFAGIYQLLCLVTLVQ